MKKFVVIILAIAFMLSLSACGEKIDLEKDESWVVINDKEIIFTFAFSEKDFEEEFDIDLDDKISDIEDEFREFLEEDGSDDYMELESIKIKKDLIIIVIVVDALDDLDVQMGDFEDLIEDWEYKDAEEFAETFPFVSYKDGDEIDSDDMDEYEDYQYIELVSFTEDGTYFTIPGKILIVDEDLDYDYVSSQTIYIDEDSSYGWVIYK